MKIRFSPLLFSASIVTALLLVVVSGVLAGRLTRRWGAPQEHNAAAKLLKSLPRQIGDWESEKESELDPKAQGILQCGDAYVNRTYKYTKEGQSKDINLIVIAGPYGPLSVHNPSVCYPTQGLKTIKGPDPYPVDVQGGPSAKFFTAVFQGSGPEDRPRHVFYAWSRGEKWEVADSPRFAFGGAPVLFKLQVDAGALAEGDESVKEFLTAFLKVWGDGLKNKPTGGDGNVSASDDTGGA